MHITKWKKPIWKGYILYDSNSMTFWKTQSYGDSKKISGCQRLEGREGWIGRAQRIFRAVKLFCMILQPWYVIIYLPKPIEYTKPKVNPSVNHRLWAIMICQCRFISYNKWTTLVSDVDNGAGWAYVGVGNIWEISVSSSPFCCEPKTALGTSLVAQWLRIRLPMQGTWVRSLVQEDPTGCRAAKPVCHNYWACALEPTSHNYWARAPWSLCTATTEPTRHNYWSPRT